MNASIQRSFCTNLLGSEQLQIHKEDCIHKGDTTKSISRLTRYTVQTLILLLMLTAVSCLFPSIPSRAEGDGQEEQNTQADQVTVPQTTGLKIQAKGTQITHTGNLGSSRESYTAKCKRIYGTSTYKPYSSSKTAEANMATITVKAWDIDASGKKYTHTLQLKVHKKIAPTMKQIFTEIYEGKEEFPVLYHCIIPELPSPHPQKSRRFPRSPQESSPVCTV